MAFSQHQTILRDYSARTIPIRTWNLCVPEGSLNATIEAMLDEGFAGPDTPSHCSRWELDGEGSAIRGRQRCWIGPGVRMQGKLEGEIGPRNIEVKRNVRLMVLSGQPNREDGSIMNGDMEFLMSITGTRVGTCKMRQRSPH